MFPTNRLDKPYLQYSNTPGGQLLAPGSAASRPSPTKSVPSVTSKPCCQFTAFASTTPSPRNPRIERNVASREGHVVTCISETIE